MSMYSSRRRSRQASRSQLGHLKLAVYEESSTLVIHIIEARGLLRKETAPYDTYAKIYLLPDPHKQSKEKTKIVKNQKDPIFNEKFSILLSESDQEKKLFISVWTHNFASRNEMIGCMTFLLSDLVGPNKGLNGWYRLLDESKGRTENVQVPNSITKYTSQVAVTQQSGEYRVFAVTLVRGPKGYGFSVHGHNPVCITEVVEGLPAHESDIKVGDIIMEVENTDVTRANGELVVNIVRKCPNTLQLILRRPMTSVTVAVTKTTSQKPPPYPQPSRQSRSFGSSLRVRSLSSNAISLSQQDEPLSFSPPAGTAQYSASQFLVPEMHDYRRLSAHFPSDFGLTQPISTYGTTGRGGLHLEPDPYIRSTYNHRRKHRSHSSSRNRIPEELRPDDSQFYSSAGSSGFNHYHDRLKPEDATRVPRGHKFGTSSFSTSRPPRYSSRNYMGSQERLQTSEDGQTSIETIAPALPSIVVRQALTQPVGVYPEEGGVSVGEGWSQGESMRPPRSSRKVVEAIKERESKQGDRGVRRAASLSPHPIADSKQVKSNGEPAGATAAMATGSTHPNGASSGNNSENQVAKAASSQEDVPIVWENLGSLGQTRQRAMNKLVNAEFAFLEKLTVGIETYIQPLRSILPESTHTVMFLGLTELHAISKEISSELKHQKMPYASKSPLPFYVSHVADIYWARLDRLVGALEAYVNNCLKARQEIGIAFTNEEFTKHVQESVVGQKKPTIYSFVEAGKEYFPKLCKALMRLVYFTPVFHEDQKHLSNIVEAIIKMSSDKELVSKWEVDQEAMKTMQIRVGFSTKVRPIVVRVPGRMLLQESEVTVIEKRKKKKVLVLLFSDMILITRRHGKVITTIEEPVYLENLIIQDINCEATEFQIQTADGSYSRLIRVSSEAEKEEWMEKLKERATGSLANRRKLPAATGEKGPTVRQALMLQSKQLLAATLAVDEPNPNLSGITALPEKGATGSSDKTGREGEEEELEDLEQRTSTLGRRRKSSNPSSKKAEESQLKRGSTKRRSLIDVEKLKKWEVSFSAMLESPDGIELFEDFLKSEFSDENIQFWKACERFKTLPEHLLEKEAEAIFEEYIAPRAPKMVNIDYQTTQEVKQNMKHPDKDTFSKAQHSIYLLMARDSFVRFVKAEPFQQALKR